MIEIFNVVKKTISSTRYFLIFLLSGIPLLLSGIPRSKASMAVLSWLI